VRRVGPRELGRRGKGRVTHPSRFDDSRCEATARLGLLHHHISSPSTTSPQGAKGPLLIASQFASGLSLGEVTVAALLQNARPRHIWPRLACKICQKNQPTSTVQYPRGYVSKSSAAHPHEGLDRMPHPILATLSPPSPLYARSGPNILIFPARPPAHPHSLFPFPTPSRLPPTPTSLAPTRPPLPCTRQSRKIMTVPHARAASGGAIPSAQGVG
jgi:hypothetical protein